MINLDISPALLGTDSPGPLGSSAQAGPAIDLQIIDLKELSFDDALFAQFPSLPFVDMAATAADSQPGAQLLPPGKELPLLPPQTAAHAGAMAAFTPVLVTPLAGQVQQPLLTGPAVTQLRQAAGHTLDHGRDLNALTRQDKHSPTQVKTGATPRLETGMMTAMMEPAVLVDERSLARPDSPGTLNQFAAITENQVSPLSPAMAAAAKATLTTNDMQHVGSLQKLSINVPVQQAAWADNLAGRVSYMLANQQHSAQISLNPAELGPIEVRVSLQNDQASVSFYAHNASVRDAIEEAFPRLREMLHENGMDLGQSSVSDQSLSGREGEAGHGHGDISHYPGAVEQESPGEEQKPLEVHTGLVDQFV